MQTTHRGNKEEETTSSIGDVLWKRGGQASNEVVNVTELPGTKWVLEPTELGYYWYRPRGSKAIAGVMQIIKHPLLGLCVLDESTHQFKPLTGVNYEWAGPLPRPKE